MPSKHSRVQTFLSHRWQQGFQPGRPPLLSELQRSNRQLKPVPGDIIATGTPGGVGRFRKPQLYLEPGMTAEVEITGVGTLINGIVDEA